MLDKVLEERIESKNAQNFWELFDFLIMYGYPLMDCLGTTLSYFTEGDIWTDVAYAKVIVTEKEEHGYIIGHEIFRGDEIGDINVNPHSKKVRTEVLEIGMIDSKNQHLLGLFDFYRKSIVDGKLAFNDNLIKEIEDNCVTKYTFSTLSPFVVFYLVETSRKHFGYNILDRTQQNMSNLVGNGGNIY